MTLVHRCNILLFTAGFLCAVLIANIYGISLRDLKLAVI